MSASDYTNWTVDDVSNWLSQINLSSLVPTFERLGINGVQLAQIDEQFIKERLRMSKPSEALALRGAIATLRDSSPPNPPPMTGAGGGGGTRKVSAQAPGHISSRPQSISAPASNRVRTNSYEKPNAATGMVSTRTLPNRSLTTPPGGFKQPMLSTGSAQVLLEDCRHCGWIIKQGGGYKNWKRRYLILRKGCLYYFANETASAPKGQFILTGYKTEICKGAEITKKYKNILKLAPVNPSIRTYYIAVGSRKELDAWKQVIDEEIASVARSGLSGRLGPTPMGNGGAAGHSGLPDRNHYQPEQQGAELNDDEDEDDETKIYEDMDDNDEHNYDIPEDATEAIYEQPPDHDDSSSDDSDPYSKIDADLSPQHLFGADGRPVVPRRSEVSLQESPHHQGPGYTSRSINVPAGLDEVPEDPTYLPIIGSGPASNPAASMPGPSAAAAVSEPKFPTHDSQSPPTVPRPPGTLDEDYEDDGNFNPDDDDNDDDDGDPYYIMIPKADELMPKECIFDRLERAEADKLLRSKNRDGTYLIRGGSHAGADKVLSVWHIDRCRHYKLFKGSSGMFSLTQGQSFRTIPELLQYYSLQSHLPRSDFYLGDPYYPSDY